MDGDPREAKNLLPHLPSRLGVLTTGGEARLTGLLALTASEERVCELAAGGLTNTQIAQRLFVTRSTVEKRLGHAYDKLRVTSRRELTDLMPVD